MSNGDFEDDWEPVSPAEMKVIQAKQERSNKISKIMGDYLLKGYKMLASSCEDCGCILLQDKQGQLYCVACNECEVEGSKDDPALSQLAADSKIREGASPTTANAAVASSGSSLSAAVDDEDHLSLPVDAGPALSNPSSSSSFSLGGIPSLMNAAPLLNGSALHGTPSSANGATAAAVASSVAGGGDSSAAAAAAAGGGPERSERSSQQSKSRHRGKITSKVGTRASAVGVRSLMCDVGRNAYEAFAAYQEDSGGGNAASASLPPPTAPPVSAASSAGVSNGHHAAATAAAKSRTPPVILPPHGPSVFSEGKLSPHEHQTLSGTLKRKLIAVGVKLEKSTSAEEDKALCALIKSYAEALEAVNNMQNS